MAYLIGSSSISAYTTNTAIANNSNYANYCGTAATAVVPNASGTATKLNLYIAGYTTIANIKVVLYENGALLSQATYNLAAIGNGFVALNFPSTAINVANKYRLAFYMDAAGTLNLWTKAGGLDLRRETIGTYTTPTTTIGDGTYRSNSEFYWSLETAPTYSIDSIDSDNILEPGQTFTINTTGFTGQPVATTNNPDITVTITGGSGNIWTATINDRTDGASYPLLPLAGVTLTLTNGAETANRLFTVTQKTTEKYITFLSANTTDGTYISYLFAQLGYTVEGAGLHFIPPVDGTDLVITHDGTVSIKSPGIIKCWFRPVSGTGAGNVFYYDVSTLLLTDAAFSFTPQTGVALSSIVTSNSITMLGINAPSPISITGGTYSINGGAYTSAAGNVLLNDVVTVRLTASAVGATVTSATLSIGGVTSTFNVTTSSGVVTTPTAFNFTAQNGVAVSTPVTSSSITVLGVTGGTPISWTVTGGTASVNGGTYSASGTAQLNDIIVVKLTTPASYTTAGSATLTLGGVTGTFTATTRAAITGFTIPSVPYDAASGKYSSRAGASGSKIIASSFVFVSFDKLTDGQSVVNTANDPGSVPGRRFSSVLSNLGFAGGYGVQGSTTVKMPGASSSCAISIKAGSDGNQGGATGAGTGSWGGSIAFPSVILEGGELWYGQYCYIPSSFSWAGASPSTQDMIKFLRLNTTKLVGRIEHYVANTAFFGGGSPYNAQEGWILANEFSTIFSAQVGKKSSAVMTLGGWSWVEFYIKAASDGNNAIRRLWVNGVLHFEYVGTAAKFRTPGGTYSTATLSSPIKTISDSTDGIADVMHGTYWNGNATQDQTYYIQKIVGHNNPAEIYAVDAFGNKMMGAQ